MLRMDLFVLLVYSRSVRNCLSFFVDRIWDRGFIVIILMWRVFLRSLMIVF